MVTHVPWRAFWNATWAPSRAGRTVPEKRTTIEWAERRVVRTCVLTRTATPALTIGLTTDGLSCTSTRYCVLIGTDSSGNAKAPCALVSCGFPTCVKPAVYGNGLHCRRR